MTFDSLLAFVRLPAGAFPVSRSVGTSLTGGVLDGRPDALYDELTFRHLLGIERRRAALAERKCLLLLVRLRTSPTGPAHERPSPTLSSFLFEALEGSVREIDMVGWYRQGRVAAVLFAHGLDPVPAGVPHLIVERIHRRLASRFPDGVTASLRLRFVQLDGSGRP